jgi:hypothetical protein
MSRVVAVIVFILAMPMESDAHRLDEYLQAARVSLARDRITLEVDLTPGANIAPAIVALLDRDGDHTISPVEAGAYGQAVLADLVLELDGRSVAVTLTRVEAPSIDDMRDGVGTIQLRAVGSVEAVAAGRRYLYFRNNHQPGASVYMINALIPEDADVRVVGQSRDPRQQGARIEYNVGPRWPAQLLWLVLGAAGLSALMALRRARHVSDGEDFRGRCAVARTTDSTRGVEEFEAELERAIELDDARRGLVRKHDRSLVLRQPPGGSLLFLPAKTTF